MDNEDRPKGKPRKRGPEAEVFKVALPFEKAVSAAVRTKPPDKTQPKGRAKKGS